ncbi:MAG: gliding motility-associated C-terminal domain-containing protein, partial [Cyclobacteriaceae bacterium]
VVSPTSITAVVAAGTSGTVSVTTPGGNASLAGFTFILAPIPMPTITSFTPTSATSGASVTITGTNFTGATTVSFGGTDAASFTVDSPTSISAVVGSGASGSVSVTTPNGTVSSPGFILLTNSPPVIAANVLTAQVESTIAINLSGFLSDPDNNLDLASLRIVTQPVSGAQASINTTTSDLTIDYTGVSFSGTDRLIIEVCDFSGACGQSELEVDVFGEIIIHNGISPNNDQKNDLFIIKYIDVLAETKNNKVTIFNRWGDQVFETTNYNNSTNVFRGLSNDGNELPNGIYFYKIEFVSGRPVQSGYLSLKK